MSGRQRIKSAACQSKGKPPVEGISCRCGINYFYTERRDVSRFFQPSYQLGYSAVRLLLERINGMDSPPQDIVLNTELKIKDSVRRLT